MINDRLRMWTVIWMAAVSSAFGLVYSQLLVKVLASITSQFMLSQTVTLACYIASMGLGSYLGDRVREAKVARRLPQIQLYSSAVGLTMVLFAYVLYMFLKFYFVEISDPREREWLRSLAWMMVTLAQPAALITGFLSGLELNLLLRIGKRLAPETGYSKVLAGSYAGTVAATLIFIWVMPQFTPMATGLGLAAANLLFSLYLAWTFLDGERELTVHCAWAAGVSVLIALLCGYLPFLSQMHYKSRELQGVQLQALKDFVPFVTEVLPQRPEMFRHSTPYQNADIMFGADGGFRFLLDYHPQIEYVWNAEYHEAFVHAPIQYSREIPREVLVLGGGDGGTAAELLKYKEAVDHIDLVELDPWMIHFAKTAPLFLDFNHGAFNDSKVRIFNQDAITYLRTTDKKYDAVYVDFPFPFETELVKLFSVEFYKMTAKALKPGGQLVVDAPAGCAKTDPLEGNSGTWRTSVMLSLRVAGFKTVFPFCSVNGFVMARLDERPPAEGYHDYGIPLQLMNAAFLENIITWKRGPEKRWRGKINSMFKPLSPLRPRHF
ncbi:MAG: hypothetical protein KF799_04850 [Bdellovibrionales bacterium]|nr:hypothetical protein [Bdellovibrionales bacterium]